MAIGLFDPTPPPSTNSSSSAAFKILTASFGDGYSQRVIDGINNVAEAAALTWTNLTLQEAQAIYTFFVGTSGVTSFYYQLPSESFWRKWVMKTGSLKRTFVNGQVQSLQVSLDECFDIDPNVVTPYGGVPGNALLNAAGVAVQDSLGNYVLT